MHSRYYCRRSSPGAACAGSERGLFWALSRNEAVAALRPLLSPTSFGPVAKDKSVCGTGYHDIYRDFFGVSQVALLSVKLGALGESTSNKAKVYWWCGRK